MATEAKQKRLVDVIEPGETAEAAPRILERLIHRAEAASASDIHLQMLDRAAVVSFRLDGVLTPVAELPPDIAERVFGRIKFLSRLKTYQESLPQDGRIDKADAGAKSDIRVATYPTVTGEKIVLRMFEAAEVRALDDLEFPAGAVKQLRRFLAQSAGLMLLTGPAGSGKTTTIYACLEELARTGGRHIITIEDPAERIIPGVMQTEVNEARNLGFAEAARHLLRQDPQVLVIGEIRDDQTANIALRAALTGHLVISALHAGSCRGVLERLSVLCQDLAALASTMELVVNQRLVRRLCGRCGGKGCDQCLGTGYQGRLPIVEWLRIQDGERRSIAGRDFKSLTPESSLEQSARVLVAENRTSAAEVSRVLGVAETD